jgi:hypothetical protein
MSLQTGFGTNIDRARLHGPAVSVDIEACLVLPDGDAEHPCRIVAASTGELGLMTLAHPRYGDRIRVYSPELGRFEGDVERETECGFVIGLDLAATRHRKLAAQLTWFANREACALPDARRHKRIVPRMQWTSICLSDGERAARINDISIIGVSVETSAVADIGDRVSFGVKTAVIDRIFDGGFVAKFDEPFEEGQLSEMIRF